MRTLAIFILYACLNPIASAEEKKVCSCKCVTKEEDGSLGISKGSGKDREAAGEDLKKNLKKKKCELSPDCTGSC
jgi:hypothetical protein